MDTDLLWKIFPPIGTFIAGIAVEKYKNRTIFLESSVNIQPIAFEANNENLGIIEVFYEGEKSQNLYRTVVEIENNTSKSVSDFVLNVSVEQGFYIYRQRAFLIQDDLTLGLHLNEDFVTRRNFVNEHFENENKPGNYEDELNYVVRHRQFHLPILNSKTKIWLEMIIDGPPNLSNVQIGIFKDNVRIIHKIDAVTKSLNRKTIVNLLASIIFFACVYPIIKYSTSIQMATWLMVVNSLTCFLGAWFIYYTYYFFSRYFKGQ